VAIFVHAAPEDHQPKWLEHIGCISPTATYYNINNGFDRWMNRSTHYWYARLCLRSPSCQGRSLAFNTVFCCFLL
jgi:hypothetical protein